MKKEKIELTKREIEERKHRRDVMIKRVLGFLLIAVMVFALCANAFL